MSKDTAPAAETDTAETPTGLSLSEALGSERHEADDEVGLDAAPAATPKPEVAPTVPATAVAVAADTPPAAQAETDPATDAKAPKWYRDHMAKTNRELAAQRAENERLRTQGPAPTQRPAVTPAAIPNPAEDAQGYHDFMARNFGAQMQRFQLETTLNLSERFARQQHGGESFEDCKAWLSTKPDIEAWAIQQPDPWAAAFTQYNRERLAEEIGDDPNAWREKERQRIRDEILAEQEGQRQAAPAPAPQMRSAPPAPASTARSAAPRDVSGRFTGPAPLRQTFKHAG